MKKNCELQLHVDGQWHDVGSVTLIGPEEQGGQAATYLGYDGSWVGMYKGAIDAHALSSQLPVSFAPVEFAHWPVILLDLLPQGFGRGELLRRLDLPETAGAPADWPLLLAGAGNSIGNLRVKEAATWLLHNAGPRYGFTDAEVAARDDEFAEHLASHGLFIAGSSGVQGEWPKLLMTRAKDGLLYLDHTVADEDAMEHFIVKFGRGANPALAKILRHEAIYMDIAGQLGLRVHAKLTFNERVLFIPRFDRQIVEHGVIRLGQESVAALTNTPGFGASMTHERVVECLLRYCTDAQAQVLEYIKRDVANLALKNTDNHARNTAIQRSFDGRLELTPLFDFAPMFLHPDGIARRTRWACERTDPSRPDWTTVLDTVEGIARACARPLNRACLVAGLQDMGPRLDRIIEDGLAMGLEPDVHAALARTLARLAREMKDVR